MPIRDHAAGPGAAGSSPEASGLAPGKRTRSERLPPVQRKEKLPTAGAELAEVKQDRAATTTRSELPADPGTRESNIARILSACRGQGVTSPISQAAILAIVSKESKFRPQPEISYANSSVAHIRSVFPAATKGHTDDEIERAKVDPQAFWELVYGYQTAKGVELGNTQAGDGGTYRGRGYNQVTGRYAYQKYGDKFDVDLIGHPELLNTDLELAAKVLVAFLLTGIQALHANGRLERDYGATGANGFTDLTMAVYAFYNANAGIKKSFETIKADNTGGLKKALDNAPGLLVEIQKH